MENNQFMYTEDQLMARLRFFIGVCLALTLTGIVFVVLYSIIFITQPLNAISPIDQKFFEMIIPIATFLTGTLSGIMLAGNDKAAQAEALKAANKGWDRPATPPQFQSGISTTVNNSMESPVTKYTFAPTQSFAEPTVGFNGKLAPPPAPQPEI